ncbi:nitroreductase family protein [Tissierella carlieri]|uniref:nitroreductase family protein n=1 Tax=Tissierella carlieri TaxID=689904 RepID=UPI00386FE2E4
MLMTNFLKKRKSVREFKNKKINSDILDEIKLYLDSLEREYGTGNLKFKLYEYGEKLYEGLRGIGGYSGVMIESPHYIGLELIDDKDRNTIYGSYYMEKLITKLNTMGLDTCWVSVGNVDKDTKKDIFGDMAGEINYILAIGYGKARNPFINDSFSDRIGVEEIVFTDKIGNHANVDDLENRGLGDLFYYIRFAPSTLNKQPWRFLLERDKVTLLIKYNKGEEPNLIDAGIVMYYFESLGESIGLNSKWQLVSNTVEEGNDCYRYIAELKL